MSVEPLGSQDNNRRTLLLVVLAAVLMLAWVLDAQRRIEARHAMGPAPRRASQPARSSVYDL